MWERLQFSILHAKEESHKGTAEKLFNSKGQGEGQ